MTQKTLTRTLFIVLFITTAMVSCQEENADGPTLPPPTVTSYSPTTAYTGNSLMINGENFGTNLGDVEVTFYEGATAVINAVNDTYISVTVPVNAYQGKITVKVKGQEVEGPSFTVMTICLAPPPMGSMPCPRVK